MMKQFFAFLISLSFLIPDLNAQNSPFISDPTKQAQVEELNQDNKAAIRRALTKCATGKYVKGEEKVKKVDGTVVEIADCEDAESRAEDFESKRGAACVKAYDEYKDDVKKSKENAEDRLAELKEDKISKQAEAQEKIVENQEAINDADLDYQKSLDTYEASLAELEKNTNEVAQAKVKEIRAKATELEKNTTVDRDEVNNQLSSKYEECKAAVMKEYYTQLSNLKQMNKLRNQGVASSGGASFAKNDLKTLKKNAKDAHSTCISNVNKSYESTMKQLKMVEKNLQAEVSQMQQELQRVTGDEYTKNIQKLQKEVMRAQKSASSKKDGLLKKNQILQQKMSQEQATMDQEIALLQARIAAGEVIDDEDKKFKGLSSKPSYYNECCSNNELRSDIAWYPGVPNTTLCKIATKRKRSTRGKPGTLQ